MVVQGATIGNEQVVPSVAFKKSWTFNINATGASPQSLLFANQIVGFEVDFGDPNFGIVAIFCACLLTIG